MKQENQFGQAKTQIFISFRVIQQENYPCNEFHLDTASVLYFVFFF